MAAQENNDQVSRKDYLLTKFITQLMQGVTTTYEQFYVEHSTDINDLKLIVKMEPEMTKH